MDLKSQLIELEGRSNTAYADPRSPYAKAKRKGLPTAGLSGAPWTIGVGHTGSEVKQWLVWTDEQIDTTFDKDVALRRAQCLNRWPWYLQMNEPRQAVLIGMVFQLGAGGVAAFVNTLRAMQRGQYVAASNGMRNSLWYSQTTTRAERLAKQMATGVWQ